MIRVLTPALVIFFLAILDFFVCLGKWQITTMHVAHVVVDIFFLVIFGFLCFFGKMTNKYYACSPCCWLLLKAFSYNWFKKMKLYSPSPLYFVHKREKSERKECPSYCQQAPLQPGVCQHSRETIKGAKKSKKSQIGKQKLKRFVVPFSYFTVTLF